MNIFFQALVRAVLVNASAAVSVAAASATAYMAANITDSNVTVTTSAPDV